MTKKRSSKKKTPTKKAPTRKPKRSADEEAAEFLDNLKKDLDYGGPCKRCGGKKRLTFAGQKLLDELPPGQSYMHTQPCPDCA